MHRRERVHSVPDTFNPRSTRKPSSKAIIILTIVLLVTLFNIYNGNLPAMSKKAIEIVNDVREQQFGTPDISDYFSSSPIPTNSSVAPTSPSVSKNTSNSAFVLPPSPYQTNITLYETTNDTNYHYEFRFEYHSNETKDDPRLIILLNGSVRTCIDYWDFPVGRRILALLHSFRFSVLVICNKKKTYDLQGPIQKNADVKWIYTNLQKWINDVYYKQFQQYPRLYFHGISRGSKLAGLLCRVLPIQHQILTASLAHDDGLFVHSDYPIDLQKRLQLDPVFANWFYFDFCYKPTLNNQTISELCPFQSERFHYQPVPPTYFIQLENDRHFNLTEYTVLKDRLVNDSFALGGKLLNDTDGVKLYIMRPSNATPTFMQETFDIWHAKPHISAIFYEHYVNRSLYTATNNTRQTCPCLLTDFRYYELHPNITQTWSKQKQDDYKDYAADIEKYIHFFCEDVCADLHTDHGMSSRHLDKALEWVHKIDSLRHSLLIEDYVSRPLRIWMYNKTSVVTNTTYFSSNQPDYVNISTGYHMYSPEYYLQDYFTQLQTSSNFSRRNLQWSDSPLLADYFIIPSDLTYYYFYPDVNQLSRAEFEVLVDKLNNDYLETLLTNIRTKFPYWTMAKNADQLGSNHVLTILNGRNIGLFSNNTQKILKNVVQIVFTGVRQDLLPPDAPPARDYRGIPVIYRHGYDVVIPQYTRLISDNNRSLNVDELVKKKKRLFFFAGALRHTMTPRSARPLLLNLQRDINETRKNNPTIEIQGNRYEPLAVIDGHLKPEEYIDSIRSTVFSLCPEGFFPWSPRFYDALQLGAIPLILADNIVLPFERFIDWPSISAKINVSNIEKMINLVQDINNFGEYMRKKLSNAQEYTYAFQWPYSTVGENGHKKHDFLSEEDQNGTAKNAFHYVSLEVRCRRLEQLYGLTSDSFSSKSIDAQQQACTAHPTICPCYDRNRTVALREYV